MMEEKHIIRINGRDIPYSIRIAPRAKRMRIVINQSDPPLSLVLPPGYPVEKAISFLESSRTWIARNLQKFDVMQKDKEADRGLCFPEILPLAENPLAIHYEWQNTVWTGAKVDPEGHIVTISGRILDPERVKGCIGLFLKRYAEKLLYPRLLDWSQKMGQDFKKLNIRIQKGRWGSCSGRGTVSLNALLLFFPQDLIDSVIVHELCHFREMNHSVRFWKEVEKYSPDHEKCRERIKYLAEKIPLYFKTLE